MSSRGGTRTKVTAAAALSGAAALLAVALRYDSAGTAANVIADVFLAGVLTVVVREYLLKRDRRRYATEARHAQQPLRARLHEIDDYLRSRHASAVALAVPAGPTDWADFLPGGDAWDPYEAAFNPDWPPSRPGQIETNLVPPPTTEADLLTVFDALRSGYPGPDLTAELKELARTAQAAPACWAAFAEHYNAMEALAPGRLIPGLPVDSDAMRDIHEPQEAAYVAAADPVKELAELLDEQHAAIQVLLTRLETELHGGYAPDDLASRSTPEPFPRWIVLGGVAAMITSALAWAVGFRIGQLGSDVTDNVLVGFAAFATGIGLAAIAGHLAEQHALSKAHEPRILFMATAAALEAAEHPGADAEAAAALRAARGELRSAVHQLQHIASNARLDTYGDLAVDRIDAWLASTEPNEVERLRTTAALAQLRELVNTLFPARPATSQPA